jgi:hypothetical protein
MHDGHAAPLARERHQVLRRARFALETAKPQQTKPLQASKRRLQQKSLRDKTFLG